MTIRSQLAVTFVLALLLAGGWQLLGGGTEDANSGEPKRKSNGTTLVLIEPVRLARDKVVVRAIGTGEALKSASLYPTVAGEVVDVAFRAEQHVTKGAALLRLDDKHQRLAVRLAEVAEKEARRQLRRLEKLIPSGAASMSRLETAQAAMESASLRLAQARAALGDRTVYAPFDGIIGLTDVEKGDRVSENTLIATLDDRSLILVEFNLPEEFAGRIKIGGPVSLRPWTMLERNMRGVIHALGSRIDPVTRSLRVKARLNDPDASIRPGTSFQVRLDFEGRNYPRVREVAVLWSRDGASVWRIRDGRAERVFVKIVRRDRGMILVNGPLKKGEMIVVEGVQGLRPGKKVKTAPFIPSKGPATPARKPEPQS
ncbi:MAG: efflux RND transporter periplasmic adaptor subunit [Alphaproteobacteria bacterium]|nr:efflux RND transporter periplasmic adaptor subunit [Alphaproteobacteria bacterium]